MLEREEEVIEILKRQGIDLVATLPCEKISRLLRLIVQDSAFCHVGLNREENGVGISAGAYLGGGKPVMVIQSTGLGNSINAIMSLTVTYRLPLPIIASWRGVYHEKIEAQVPLGMALPGVIDALGLNYTIIDDSSEIWLVEEVIQDAFENERPHIALISPRTWETAEEVTEEPTAVHPRRWQLRYERPTDEPEMRRYDAIRIISEYLSEEAVIANIGVPSKELYAARDRDLNFYMLGSLGQASAIGLGVALETRRETVVLDGDGSLLMSNILPVIAGKKPENLSILCLDNGTWGSTGDQPVPPVDMELMAISAGITTTRVVNTAEELRSSLEHLYDDPGPRFLLIRVKPGNAEVGNVKLSAEEIKRRFTAAMGHAR